MEKEKQLIMQKVSRFLASCHYRNVADVIESSILIPRNSQTSGQTNSPKPRSEHKPTNLSDFFESARRRTDSKITQNSSSSNNNSTWFSIEDAEIDEESETISSISSFSSSEGSSNATPRRETAGTRSSRCDTEMGFSRIHPSEVKDSSGAVKSCRTPSSSSCGRYYNDFGSSRRETTEIRRVSGEKEMGYCSFDSSDQFGRRTTQKCRGQNQTNRSQPRTEQSPKVSNRQRRIEESSDDEMGEVSSISSTNDSYRNGRKTTKTNPRKTRKNVERGGKEMIRHGKVEESYAVEKSSTDPYNDFRISMVEMIEEKQIFGEEELERLLECFLFLNSAYHRDVIIRVFLEVCTTLFPR